MYKKKYNQTINRVLEGSNTDRQWYKSYMIGNSPRILSDFLFIRKHIDKKAEILDIGSIPPLMSAILKENGYMNITVVDPYPENFEFFFNNTSVNFIKQNIMETSINGYSEKFDLIIFSEVIEHLTGDVLTAIKNVIRHLKPNGHILVTTPNVRSIWGLFALIFKSSALASKPFSTVREQYERKGYYGHVREYTNKEIQQLFESFDLKLVDSKYQISYSAPNRIHYKIIFYLINIIEFIFPKWRLFGKYLFVKPAKTDLNPDGK